MRTIEKAINCLVVALENVPEGNSRIAILQAIEFLETI